jgi:hypothetical protein
MEDFKLTNEKNGIKPTESVPNCMNDMNDIKPMISTTDCMDDIKPTNEKNGIKPTESFPNRIDDTSDFKPMISTTHCMDDSKPTRNVPNYVMKKYCFRKTSEPRRPQPRDPTVHVKWQSNHDCDGQEVLDWLEGHGKFELVDLVSGVLAGDIHETSIMTVTFEKVRVAERLCLQPMQYISNQQLQQKFPVHICRMSAET